MAPSLQNGPSQAELTIDRTQRVQCEMFQKGYSKPLPGGLQHTTEGAFSPSYCLSTVSPLPWGGKTEGTGMCCERETIQVGGRVRSLPKK